MFQRGYHQAASAFIDVLGDITSELSLLRSPLVRSSAGPEGDVCKKYVDCCQ